MTDADNIADLLLTWEEHWESGKEVKLEELCRDCPHLIPAVSNAIQGLKATAWLSASLQDSGIFRSSVQQESPIGTLANRYRLDGKIGEGGFGEVWKGYDLDLRRAVAVKRPKRTRLGKTDRLDSFVAEARRVAGLKHPGVVPVFDVGREGDAAFIVSEWIEGGSLAERLIKKPPSQSEAVRLLAEIAETLAYAHKQGFLHRDIKPANILLDHHERALITDFGIARSADEESSSAISFGTLAYMAPEQLEGKLSDHRADIYSLGVVMFELLTGKKPFSSSDPVELRRQVLSSPTPSFSLDARIPNRLAQICSRCLDRNPVARYSNTADLAHDLRTALARRSPIWNYRRFMLVALLALGGVAGWYGIPAKLVPQPEIEDRPTDDEQSGAKWIFSVGGRVNDIRRERDLIKPWTVHFAYLHKDHCDDRVTDAGLENLKGCRDLHLLNFGAAKIDGSGLIHLKNATKLTWLSLECTQVNDVGLAHLAECTDLTYLNLLCTPVTDQAVETILKFPKLEMVVLSSTHVTQKGVDRIHIGLPECRVIWEPPSTVAAALALAQIYMDKKDWEAAEMVYSEAIRIDPKSAKAYHRRAGCRFNTKRAAESLTDFERALLLDPTNPEILKNRALVWQNLSRCDDAVRDLKIAIELKPADIETYRKSLGLVYAQKALLNAKSKNWAKAIIDIDEAIKLDRKNADYWGKRGGLFFNSGQFEKAILDLSEAIRLDSSQREYRLHRGYAYEALGKKTEAAEDYRKAK